MKYFVLLFFCLTSGCTTFEANTVSIQAPETLSGKWEKKIGTHLIQSIRFQSNLSCSTFNKSHSEALITACRYERKGNEVVVYDINPRTKQDTGYIRKYEYDKNGERLFSYRDRQNEENSVEYLKDEN